MTLTLSLLSGLYCNLGAILISPACRAAYLPSSENFNVVFLLAKNLYIRRTGDGIIEYVS